MVDLFGAVLERVLVPEGGGGVLLVLRSKPRVDPGELVAVRKNGPIFSAPLLVMRNAHLPRQARDRQIRKIEETVFSPGNCRALATSLPDDSRRPAGKHWLRV